MSAARIVWSSCLGAIVGAGRFEIRKYRHTYNLRRYVVSQGYELLDWDQPVAKHDRQMDAKAHAEEILAGRAPDGVAVARAKVEGARETLAIHQDRCERCGSGAACAFVPHFEKLVEKAENQHRRSTEAAAGGGQP